MMNIKFINATSVQLVDQAGNTVQNVGEFISPTEFSYSGNSFSKNEQNYYHFAITGTNVQLSGYIDSVTQKQQYCNLFKNCTNIKSANYLILSAPNMKQSCYANMFKGCVKMVGLERFFFELMSLLMSFLVGIGTIVTPGTDDLITQFNDDANLKFVVLFTLLA